MILKSCDEPQATDDYSTSQLTYLLINLSRVFTGLLDTIYAMC